eukprot:353365-Hanusia_phi.AAC.1
MRETLTGMAPSKWYSWQMIVIVVGFSLSTGQADNRTEKNPTSHMIRAAPMPESSLSQEVDTPCPDHAVSTTRSDCTCAAGYRCTMGKNCIACPMGSYNSRIGNYACETCPENTWSDMASISNESCLCLPGYSFDSNACIQCGLGFYKNFTGQESCSRCPMRTTSNLGSTSIQDCYCIEPYVYYNNQCQLCPVNTYSSGQTCESCPPDSYSSIGSTSITECLCKEPYIKLNDGSCALCPANSYRLDYYTCLLCPFFSKSKEGGYNISDCMCNPGYFGSNGKRCIQCPIGTYSPTINSVTSAVNCISCPPNSSSSSGSYSIDSCLCVAGYYKNSNIVGGCFSMPYDEGTEIRQPQKGIDCNHTYCIQCPQGKYKSDTLSNACSDCPANTDSPAGSTDIRQCTCNPGYVGLAGQACTACSAGKYTYNTFYCASCPANTYSMQASNDITQCGCNAGHSGIEGSTCIACAMGKYKPFVGPGNCINCPANTLSPRGASNITDCYCPVGFYTDITSCTLCPAGKYNDQQSQTFCKDCIPFSTSQAGSTTITSCTCKDGYIHFDSDQLRCVGCPAGKYKLTFDTCAQCPINSYSSEGSQFRTQCSCKPGFTGNDGESCPPCPIGTYKDKPGSSPCKSCGEGTVSIESSTSSSQCICQRGYYYNGTSCSQCSIGKFQNTINQTFCYDCKSNSNNNRQGSFYESECVCKPGYQAYTDQCIPCKIGQYQDPTDLYCKSCGVGFYSPPASTGIENCICDVGFYLEETGCVFCPIGNYSDTYGSTYCKSCPKGSTTLIYQSSSLNDCLCTEGYYNTQGSCSMCEVGSYKTNVGNFSCNLCDPNAVNYKGSSKRLDCSCREGYNGVNGGTCTPCAENTFKFKIGIGTCYKCPVNSFSSAASTDISNCSCRAGYTDYITGDQSKTCSPCPPNSYKAVNGRSECISCPENSFSPIASNSPLNCTCNPGYYQDAITRGCMECGFNHYNPYPGKTFCKSCTLNSFTYSSTAVFDTECTCKTGYTGNELVGCNSCPSGSYKSTVGTAPCSYCGPHFTSPKASSTADSCECDAGFSYAFDPFNLRYYCSFCVSGKYKNFTGNSDCVDCPYGTTSKLGGTNCFCGAGFYVKHSSDCTACEVGKYSEDDMEYCVDCPENTTTVQSGSDLLTKCVCIPGHTALTTGTPCFPCSSGKYKSETASIECTVCPENQYSEHGQDAVTGCYCNAGYYKTDSGACGRCPTGTYKSLGFETFCINCPYSMISNVGSIDISQCICTDGFVMIDGQCYECPINTYADRNSCIPCPAHSTSPSKSSSINSCECMAGYYYFANITAPFECVDCPVSTYKDSVGKYTKVNIARTGKARVSTVVSPAFFAIDGYTGLLTISNLFACAYTALEQSPWLRIDLGRPLDIDYVSIYATDQSNIQLRVGNSTDISETLMSKLWDIIGWFNNSTAMQQ